MTERTPSTRSTGSEGAEAPLWQRLGFDHTSREAGIVAIAEAEAVRRPGEPVLSGEAVLFLIDALCAAPLSAPEPEPARAALSCMGCGQATPEFVTGCLEHSHDGLCRRCVSAIGEILNDSEGYARAYNDGHADASAAITRLIADAIGENESCPHHYGNLTYSCSCTVPVETLNAALAGVASCRCGCTDHICEHSGFYVCESCPPEKGCHRAAPDPEGLPSVEKPWDQVLADPALMEDIRAGLADVAAGRTRPWDDIKRAVPDPEGLPAVDVERLLRGAFPARGFSDGERIEGYPDWDKRTVTLREVIDALQGGQARVRG